jgi:hypothetical protein
VCLLACVRACVRDRSTIQQSFTIIMGVLKQIIYYVYWFVVSIFFIYLFMFFSLHALASNPLVFRSFYFCSFRVEGGKLIRREMSFSFHPPRIDREVAIVKGYPIEGGFAIAFFLCIFT